MFAAAIIMLGGVLLSVQARFTLAAVGSERWKLQRHVLSGGIDNNLTQRVSLPDPVAVLESRL